MARRDLAAEVEAWCVAMGLGRDPRLPPPDGIYRPRQPDPPCQPADTTPVSVMADLAIVAEPAAADPTDACPTCWEETRLWLVGGRLACADCLGELLLEPPTPRPRLHRLPRVRRRAMGEVA